LSSDGRRYDAKCGTVTERVIDETFSRSVTVD
jgi:hypothetical protein